MPFPGRGRGGEASQLGAASRRPFIRVAERLPRVHASAHPHPALPHPGETGRGPEPRDPGRARCAQPSSRLFIAPRPLRLRARPGPSAQRLWDRVPPVPEPGRGLGAGGAPGRRAGLPNGRLSFRGRDKARALHPSARSGVCSGGFPRTRVRAGAPSGRPGCNVRPAATPSRLSGGSSPGRQTRPARKVGARSSRPHERPAGGRAGAGSRGDPRCRLREAGGHLGRGRDSTAGERRASRSQMGTQGKGTQLPEGMRA
ncbi:translation initiation factor IF-2-like [Acinonyx jubatus]|uniref:Translation initiation factor IF-2-like n=1 Tax=Acinonyx jubatus TaxID=32536 RepID=A0ABM3NF35_ACIJB|nr:translation initiation factor IF-2-like [Acinonyx jubatus]